MKPLPKLATVNEHALPYRVLIEELQIRRPDVVPPDVATLLDDVDAAHMAVKDLEALKQPRLVEYRQALEKCAQTEKRLKDILHAANLKALCFSGGGIRSASFGLGVLHGLAQVSVTENSKGPDGGRGLLEEIDYVSTVSGGGYVGSWLTGWIKNHIQGFRGVIRDLAAYRLTSVDPEPAPSRHLRDYTSYLAPRTGAFSTDTWTLAAIVLRNLLLNWAILIPAFAALLLLPVLNSELLFWATSLRAGRLEFSLGAAIFALVALLYITCKLPGNCVQTPTKTNFIWPGACFVVSAWCFAGFYLTDSVDYKNKFFYIWLLAIIAHAGLLIGRLVFLFRRGSSHPLAWRNLGLQVLVSVPTSLFAAALLWLLHVHVAEFLFSAEPGNIRLFTSLYVPLVWLAFMLTVVLMDGLSARFEDDQDREWWSRSGAFMMRAALLWAAAHLLVLYAPDILQAGNAVFSGGHVPQGATISLLTVLIGSLASWAGFSPATPSGRAKADFGQLEKIRGFLAKRDLLIPALGGLFFVLLALTLADANATIWPWLVEKLHLQFHPSLLGLAITVLTAVFFNIFVNVNTFSLHAMYRNRLVRSYLGASNNKRKPNPFTNFDPADDFPMSQAPKSEDAPLHVINIALNVVATKNLAWQQRKAESFTISPLRSGSFRVGYQPTGEYGNRLDGISIGTAMAISGAAASPNMGYHSSPILTLAMTFFNARLGWWLANPGEHGRAVWTTISPLFSLWPLLNEGMGRTNDHNRWVYVSDGGHFENLALYEMVLRRCKKIIVVDGSADPGFRLEDLGNAVRKIYIDLGVPIEFDPAVAFQTGPEPSNRHCFVGKVRYSLADADEKVQARMRELAERKKQGTLEAEEELELRELDQLDGEIVYIKASLNGNEPADVTQYAKSHPPFPHETTANQFFNESQFESYVRLGNHIVAEIVTGKYGANPPLPLDLDKFFEAARKHAGVPAV